MAYMPQSYVDGMYSTLDLVRSRFISCFQNLSSGGIAIAGGDLVNGGEYVRLAGVYGLQANSALTWSPANSNFRYFNNLAMQWIQDNLNSTPGGSVTLQGMIDAIFAGTYEEVRDWLGTQWACQQVMWDQPFFVQPYLEMVNRLRT
jgi:hypothetical protein